MQSKHSGRMQSWFGWVITKIAKQRSLIDAVPHLAPRRNHCQYHACPLQTRKQLPKTPSCRILYRARCDSYSRGAGTSYCSRTLDRAKAYVTPTLGLCNVTKCSSTTPSNHTHAMFAGYFNSFSVVLLGVSTAAVSTGRVVICWL